MRIGAAALSHGTNRFSTVQTDLRAFERAGIHRGPEIHTVLRNTNTPFAGFFDAAEEHAADLIPILAVRATPSGLVTQYALETLLSELLDGISQADPIDGVLLALHGAMVSQDVNDADGYILRRVREQVGRRVPIVATLDLHANISEQMVEQADLLIGDNTYPHVDQRERARDAGNALINLIAGNWKPSVVLLKPPMMPTSQNMTTDVEPMRSIVDKARNMEAVPEVINVTVSGGFPPADVYEAGFSVLVTTDNDPALAETLAFDLANYAWSQRSAFLGGVSTWDDAAKAIAQIEQGPLVLVDIGDNPWSGGPGDCVALLRFLLDQNVERAAIALIRDPESVQACLEAGPGAEIALSLGGKTDDLNGEPLTVYGYVETISDGRFINQGPIHTGVNVNLGRTVVLRCNEIRVLVTEYAETPIDRNIFRRHGIEPEELRVIGLKGKGHFRASFAPIAERVILVEGPGTTGADLSRLDFTNVRRPIWPLDPDVTYSR